MELGIISRSDVIKLNIDDNAEIPKKNIFMHFYDFFEKLSK